MILRHLPSRYSVRFHAFPFGLFVTCSAIPYRRVTNRGSAAGSPAPPYTFKASPDQRNSPNLASSAGLDACFSPRPQHRRGLAARRRRARQTAHRAPSQADSDGILSDSRWFARTDRVPSNPFRSWYLMRGRLYQRPSEAINGHQKGLRSSEAIWYQWFVACRGWPVGYPPHPRSHLPRSHACRGWPVGYPPHIRRARRSARSARSHLPPS